MPISLNAQHTLEIGRLALEQKAYTLALPWFQAAITLNNQNLPALISNNDVATDIAQLITQHDIDYDKKLAKGLFYYEEKLRYNISARTMREIKMNYFWGIRPSAHESYDSEIAYYNLLNVCNGRGFVVSWALIISNLINFGHDIYLIFSRNPSKNVILLLRH